MEVYVVTNVEDGWDCVRGVFGSLESLKDWFTMFYEFLEDENELKHYESLTEAEFETYVADNPRTENFCIFIETVQ